MATSLKDLVQTLQDSLRIVHTKSQNLGVRLTKAELEAQVIANYEASAGWKFELIGVDVSADYKNKHTNTVTMELIPTGTGGNLGFRESDTLAEGIIQLANEVNNISKGISKDFSVGDFGLTIEVEVEKSGGVKIVAGGDTGRGTGHKIKLTFRSRQA